LINLAASFAQPAKLIFCSSTASVTEYRAARGQVDTDNIPEIISHDPSDAGRLGYSRSKWVAERICNLAVSASSLGTQGKIKIARIGQLTGATDTGIWNMKEAWPLILSTVHELGCLPDIDESLSWLPLNTAAQVIVDIAQSDDISKHGDCQVYHIVSNSRSTTWKHLLKWLKSVKEFDIVTPRVWLDKLEGLEAHPAKQLLGLWRNAYAEGESSKQISFSTKEAEEVSEIMRNVPAVDEKLVLKIWEWMEGERRKNGQTKSG
jgi:thioester reductase-like protein